MQHYDRCDVAEYREQPDGSLIVRLAVARPGILNYVNPDTTTRREYVPREELLSDESTATLRRLTVTLQHPGSGMVTPENYSDVSVGDTGSDMRVDGDIPTVDAVIRDASAIASIRAGVDEVSAGYRVDFEEIPGTDAEFGDYDGIQRNRRYNHIAIVSRGRAGPVARVRVDHSDGGSMDWKEKLKAAGVADDKIVGLAAEIASEVAAVRVDSATATAQVDTYKAVVANLTKDRDKLRVRIDAMDVETLGHTYMVERSKRVKIAKRAKIDIKDDTRNDAIGELIAAKLGIPTKGWGDKEYGIMLETVGSTAFVDTRLDSLDSLDSDPAKPKTKTSVLDQIKADSVKSATGGKA